MRLHRCAEVGCRELIKLGFDYCDAHYSQRMSAYHDRRAKADELATRTLRGKARFSMGKYPVNLRGDDEYR